MSLSPFPAFGEGLDLLHGHFEVQADYRPDTGWWLGPTYNQNEDFNDRDQVRRLEAATTRYVAPPRARVTGTAATSFLLPAGEPLWLLPQSFQTGNHYLGMRVVADSSIFQTRVGDNYSNLGRGSISLRLLSVTGSGPDRGGNFALWESDPVGGQTVYFNSKDGISEADEIPTLPVGAHSHVNWGFTQPGEYRVTFEAFGRLRPAGTPTSQSETFTFIIPHSGVLTALDAELCRRDGELALVTGDRAAGVAYGPNRSFIETVPAPEESPFDAVWQCPFRLAADGWEVSDYAGVSAELAGSGANVGGGTRLNLLAHRGPGEVILVDESGAILCNSGDGFGPGDEIDLSGGAVTGTLYFTAKGIHTLKFGDEAATGTGFEVRCGAGLAIDYNFSDWADSYERAHGLAAGALSDPEGDFNNDGRVHQLEYFLDASGVDPVTGGSALRVGRDSGGEFGRLIFLRDLYKDSLSGEGPELQSGFSEDLENWSYLSVRNVGFPLEFFETDAEQGNARSLLMMRALRRKIPESGQDFFRLRVEGM